MICNQKNRAITQMPDVIWQTLKLLLALAFVFLMYVWATAQADPLDKPYNRPLYLIHITSVSTISGPRATDYYVLWEDAGQNGVWVRADGEGGTQGHYGELIAGPFRTPREVCLGGGNRPPKSFFDGLGCNRVSPRPTPTPTPVPTPTPGTECRLQARLDCPSPLELVPAEVSKVCYLYVNNWRYADAYVEVSFPQKSDNWGSLPGGIVIFGDGKAWPPNMYRPQHAFTLMFSARSTAPRSEQQISIIVSQPGCWGVQLTQTIRVLAKAPAGLTGRVNFASVMALGYNLGFAETGAYQNAPVNSVIGPLNSARQIAVALNLPPDGIDALLRSLPAAGRSSLFYQDIVTTRQVLERMISRNCNCGPIINPWYAFTSGYQMALAEYASYQNADFRTVNQLLTWARQNASNSGLPINGFDYPLEQLNRGVPPANVYQYIAGLRAQLMQQANFWCNC